MNYHKHFKELNYCFLKLEWNVGFNQLWEKIISEKYMIDISMRVSWKVCIDCIISAVDYFFD